MPKLLVQIGHSNKTRIACDALALFLASYDLTHAFVERVHASPQMGVSSAFAFGQAAGIIQGMLAGFGVPVTYSRPSDWKRDMGLSQDKDESRELAIKLAPLHANDFRRKRDADRAEAYLIALHGLRMRQKGFVA